MKIMLVVFLVIIVAGLVAWKWVNGIDYMIDTHSDYNGDDFLNWNGENSNWDGENSDWDKSTADLEIEPHTENSI